MSIKATELPDLIAAAVRKAVADKVITDETVQSLLHVPIRIGIIRAEHLPAHEELKLDTPQPSPWKTIGYVMDGGLGALRNVETLKATDK